ncbi:signal peptidase II [Erythrobacter sp. 3-20A1M]|uniref:signal peptidase II n=1 Tax=Erythrobacter sp. 3-20A1M TaxID=2653850 RepID=UPI0035302691
MRARLAGIGIAALVCAVDQWLKVFVTRTLGIDKVGEHIDVLPIFALRFTRNYGVSLGMFEADSEDMRWILVGVTALIALGVFVWIMREKLLGDIFGLALILGGALGNIYDRYSYGYVIDYADLHFGAFRPFLIFNVADAAITIGVLIILARSFLMREKRGDKEPGVRPAES